MSPFETWKDPNTGVVFYFSHSDELMTTGVMMIPPHASLPKHNRPLAYENLIQLIGRCKMTVFEENGNQTEYTLNIGDKLRMEKGQYHIHANPYNDASFTLFKAEGDITEIMKVLRETFEKVDK